MQSFKSSEQLNELYAALAKAQADIVNPTKNNSAHNFKYANLADVLDCIRVPFSENGLSVIQMPFSFIDKDGIVRDGVSTRLCHSSGQWMETSMLAPVGGAKAGSAIQNVGLHITYMRRYMLAAMAGVYQEDDENKLTETPQYSGKQNSYKQSPQPNSQTVNDVMFRGMLNSVKSGQVTIDALKSRNSFTAEQEAMLMEAVNA